MAFAKLKLPLHGHSASGCPTCGEVFSTTANFDKHRKGTHGVDRHCVNPESVGLVQGGRHGYWMGEPNLAWTERVKSTK